MTKLDEARGLIGQHVVYGPPRSFSIAELKSILDKMIEAVAERAALDATTPGLTTAQSLINANVVTGAAGSFTMAELRSIMDAVTAAIEERAPVGATPDLTAAKALISAHLVSGVPRSCTIEKLRSVLDSVTDAIEERAPHGGAMEGIVGYKAQGFAADFLTRSAEVYDSTGVLSASGSPQSILTVWRATVAGYTDSDRVLKFAATNTLRYDHVPSTGAARGLLAESTQNTLETYSRDFSQAAWGHALTTRTTGQASARFGDNGATKITPTTTSGEHYLRSAVSHTAGATLTPSYIVKADGYSRVHIRILDNAAPANGFYTEFNLGTGTVGSTTLVGSGASAVAPTITPLGNDEYRIVAPGRAGASTTTSIIDLFIRDNAGNVVYAGDGTKGVIVSHANIVEAAYASSEIVAVASTVTRSGDAVTKALSSVPYTHGDFTLLHEFTLPNLSGFDRNLVYVSGAAGHNILLVAHSTGVLYWFINTASVLVGTLSAANSTQLSNALAAGTVIRAAIAVHATGARTACNIGGTPSISFASPPTLTTYQIRETAGGQWARKSALIKGAWTQPQLDAWVAA